MQPQFEILADPEDDAETQAANSLEVGRIVPIYESAADRRLSAKWFRRVIRGALEQIVPDGSSKSCSSWSWVWNRSAVTCARNRGLHSRSTTAYVKP